MSCSRRQRSDTGEARTHAPSVLSQALSRVGISGTTAKSGKRKFVPPSHPGPLAVDATSRKSQTKVGTLACFDFL